MRTGSKLLAAAGVLLALVLIGVAIVVATFDVSALVGPVQARVKAATGRDLVVRGGVSVAWSLEPRVVLKDVALGNAAWGAAKEMVTAQRLEIELALLPLLTRRVELKEIALIAPVIALETDGKGRNNWDFARVPASGSAGGDTGAPAFVAIGNLSIANGALTFRDGATGGVTSVAIGRLSVRARDASSPVAADFRGTVRDVPVALAGTLGSLDALLQRRWPYPVNLQGTIAGQTFDLATKVKADGARYALDDLKLTIGASAVTGSFAVETAGARPRVLFDLSGPAIALAALPAAGMASTPAAGGTSAGRAYLIPDTPFNFAPIRAVDAEGALALARLTLPDGRRLDNLRAKVALDNGRLAVTDFAVAAYGGTLAGSAVVDTAHADRPTLAVELSGKGLTLGELLKAAGHPRDVRGGSTDVSANLAMRGASAHAWAASASGNVRVVVGPATLVNTNLDLESAIDRLAQAVNPFRSRDPSTELTCAVVQLPLKDGVARVDRSIAAETKKLGVSVSGTVDFRNETLDFTFQPKVRTGIAIDIANVAELVRFSGPFARPQVSVDPVGSAKAIASIGAAVGTGGLSIVAQSLLGWADGKGPGPCQVALGAAAPAAAGATASSTAADPMKPLVDDVGRAVGKLFGR